MNEKLKELLDAKIEAELNALDDFDPTTEEHYHVVENVVKLYKLKTDEEKAVMEDAEKRLRREMEAAQFERDIECRNRELQLKEEQLSEQTREHDCEANLRERELQFEEARTEWQRIVEYAKLGAEIAGIVLPLMFYGRWMAKGLKFEETGTFTSTTFRNLFTRFKPTGK